MGDCHWRQEDERGDLWVSDCGIDFIINDGPPSENHMIFCCGCGKPLVEIFYEVEDDE